MPRYRTQRYQVGEWWLGHKPGSPAWHRCRYNSETEQTERVSLRTTDFEEAKRRLDEWFLASHEPESATPESVTLAEVLANYYREHACNTASAETVRIHAEIWLSYWKEATLADLTLAAQRQFHRHLKKQGKAPSYIQRMVTTARAACNFAWKNGEIAQQISFVTLPRTSGIPRGRPLEPEEIRALFNAVMTEHMYRYLIILIATAARPNAALDLHSSQLDRTRGLIHLNPSGRTQNKKYRPTVRMPEFFKDAVGDIEGNIVTGNETRIGSVKKAWRGMRRRAGLDDTVTSYSIRHTLARELRARSVPAWEVAAQLGHQMPGLTTTEIYAPYDPMHLVNAVAAIEAIFKEVMES